MRTEPAAASSSGELKSTSLTYLINYGVDTYDLVANFDVLFLPHDSSTNGCTAHIHGRYGETVKSDELTLTGKSEGFRTGDFMRSTVSKKKYYLTGVINRPDTEETRQRNLRALTLHVEESYTSDYQLR